MKKPGFEPLTHYSQSPGSKLCIESKKAADFSAAFEKVVGQAVDKEGGFEPLPL
jgi:hypothetical protein